MSHPTDKENLYFNLEWYAAQTGRAHLVKPIDYYDKATLYALVAQLKALDAQMNHNANVDLKEGSEV